MRYKTLEEFLEGSCGMAPPALVEHYESHREFVETCLADYNDLESDTMYEVHVNGLWIMLPELPDEFFYKG